MRKHKKFEILKYEFDEEFLTGEVEIKIGSYIFQLDYQLHEYIRKVRIIEKRGRVYFYKNEEVEQRDELKDYKPQVKKLINWWNNGECFYRNMQIFLKDRFGRYVLGEGNFFEAPHYY